MATRARQQWKLDSQGQYPRQIGWKFNRHGRRVQHKFRLGSDLNEARRRDQRLRELWERIEAISGTAEPHWDELSLEIGRQLAKGATQVQLPPYEAESDESYAERIRSAGIRFPSIRFQPSDVAKFAAGSGSKTWSESDLMIMPASPREEFERRINGFDDYVHSILNGPAGIGVAGQGNTGSVRPTGGFACEPVGVHDPGQDIPQTGPQPLTLHQALQDYIDWIERHYFRQEFGGITNTGQTKIRQVRTLMGRHADVSLAGVNHEAIEQMICYWRQRPHRKGTDQPVSRTSAENYIGELKRFFKWLHRSSKHAWRKPEGFDEIDTSVDRDHAATQRRLVQASVFSRDELILLNRYATPMDRVFLLLGLNCAFGVAEIASLTVGELCLGQTHSQREQELLRFETTDQDSFIKRIRRKSGVYGEFILFPQTVQAIQWAESVRRRQGDFHPDAILLLNGKGERFDRPTSSGNRNQQIPNRFAALRRRIRKEGHEISNLSFGKLRKTSADLIRQFSDGEIAGVFLCHGKPVASDHLSEVYTNRPFGKVFAAIRSVEKHLQPVFEAAGTEPFPSGSKR